MLSIIKEKFKNKDFESAIEDVLVLSKKDDGYYNLIVEANAFNNKWQNVIDAVLHMVNNNIFISRGVIEKMFDLFYLAFYKTNSYENSVKLLKESLQNRQKNVVNKIYGFITEHTKNYLNLYEENDFVEYFENKKILVDWDNTYLPSMEATGKKVRPDIIYSKRNKTEYLLGRCGYGEYPADFIRVYFERETEIISHYHLEAAAILISEGMLEHAKNAAIEYTKS